MPKTWTSSIEFHTLDALRSGAFRSLWVSGWLWDSARLMEITVIPWLALELTNSAAQVAFVGVFRMAPMFLLGVVAGSLADRFPTKRIMLAAHALGTAVSVLILVVIWVGKVEAWHLLLLSFAAGIAGAMDFPAKRSYLAQHFSGSSLINALSLESVAFQGSNIVGPLLGGSLIALAGYKTTFALMAALHLVDLLFLLTLPDRHGSCSPASPSSMDQRVLDVARVLWADPAIRTVLLTTMTLNLFGFPCMQLLPVIARNTLGVGSSLYGAMRAVKGLGSLVGALAIASLSVRRKTYTFILGSAAMLACWFVLGTSRVYSLSLALLFLAGLGQVGFGTMQSTIVLHSAPEELRGRAMGAVSLAIGVGPIGTLMAGALAETLGAERAILTLSATGLLVIGSWSRCIWRLRRQMP